MSRPISGNAFLEEVVADTPGGESLVTCLRCGTCGGSCPSCADMDHTRRKLFAWEGRAKVVFLLAGR